MLDALTHCVRAFSREQIAAEFFGNQPHKLEQLSAYVERGLLVNRAMLVRQLPIPVEPIFTWSIGNVAPDFEKLVAVVRSRWSGVPTRKTQVYLRGPVATKLLGGVGGNPLKRPLQASHDIGLSGVYLANRRTRPEIAKFWYGEDLISGLYRKVVPDALYINERSEAELAIEFCGLYSASRFKKFHGHVQKESCPMNSGKPKGSRSNRKTLGSRDRRIVDEAIRFRLLTNEAIHHFHLPSVQPNAITKVTARLVKQDGWLLTSIQRRRSTLFREQKRFDHSVFRPAVLACSDLRRLQPIWRSSSSPCQPQTACES